MNGTARPASSAADLVGAASAGSDQTVSTAVIGLFTLVTTVVIMYLIARGPRRRDDD